MTEFAALHEVSLLLTGSNIQVNPSQSSSRYDNSETIVVSESESDDEIPDDERLMDSILTKTKTNNNKTNEETTGIEAVMQPEQEKEVLVLVDDETSGPDESRWRAHGLARRRKILEDDRKNGGRNFTLSYDCSIQRYFSVAHWALEQFHQLYQNSSSVNDEYKLEEIYVMGFRIISFLTECLPRHPGMKRAPLIKERSKQELEHLRKCLRDIALRIDECVCNKFVEDGDMFLDSLIASEMDKEDTDEANSPTKTRSDMKMKASESWSSSDNEKTHPFESWVNFDEFNKIEQENSETARLAHQRKLSESPTSETVGTSGSASDAKSISSTKSNSEEAKYVRRLSDSDNSEAHEEEVDEVEAKVEEVEENYFGDDDRVIRENTCEIDDLSLLDELSLMDESVKSYSSQPFALLKKSVSLDFLKTIACEPVFFETDSDAADSWANNDGDRKSRPCVPSSSGVAPTSDPARIAFRNLMSKLPHRSILQRNIKQSVPDPTPEDAVSKRQPSPTFSDIMEERDSTNIPTLDDESLDEVFDYEIQEYLDKKLGKRGKKLKSSNKKLGKLDRKLNREESKKTHSSSRSSRSSRNSHNSGNSRSSRNSHNSGNSRSSRGSRSSGNARNSDTSVHSASSASTASSASRTHASGTYSEDQSIRRSRRKEKIQEPPLSFDDSSYSSYSESGVYSGVQTNRRSRRSDHQLNSSMSSDASTRSVTSHQNIRKKPRPIRDINKQIHPVSSDESSYSSESSLSANQEVRSRRAPQREYKHSHSFSSDTSMTSTGTPSSSYTSLASLRRRTGSDSSAFTAVHDTEQKKERKQRRKQSAAHHKSSQDDWTSFDSSAGSEFFTNSF